MKTVSNILKLIVLLLFIGFVSSCSTGDDYPDQIPTAENEIVQDSIMVTNKNRVKGKDGD